MYADDIKLKLLNWLLPRFSSDDLVGSELRMLDSSHIADMVLTSKKKLVGLEIKSKRDKYVRLEKQAVVYTKMFHESYLVAEKSDVRLLGSVINVLPKRMGIVRVDENEIEIFRPAQEAALLEKKWAVRWLGRKELVSVMRAKGDRPSADHDIEQLRTRALRFLSQDELNVAAVESVRGKLFKGHQEFIAELGKVATADDLINLASVAQFISSE